MSPQCHGDWRQTNSARAIALKSRKATNLRQHAFAGVLGHGAELLLDAEELVVFGEAVGAGERAGLDLPAVGGDGEVGDGGVLGFAGAVAHDGGEARAVGEIDGVEGLGQGADLVNLHQNGIGNAHLDAVAQTL